MPLAIGYSLFRTGFGRYPLDVWSSLSLRRPSRGHPALRLTMSFLLITRYPSLFFLYAICHLCRSDMCPFGGWSSLRCGGFLTGIMLSALFHMLLAISHLPYAIRHMPLAIGYSLFRTGFGRYPPSMSVPRFAAEAISRASCPPPSTSH